MSDFKAVVSGAYAILQAQISVFGFTFSLWQMFLFFCLAGIVMSFFFGIMD